MIEFNPLLGDVKNLTSDSEKPIVSNQNSPRPHNVDKASKNNFLYYYY